MSLDFNAKTFGAQQAAAATKEDRPKAEFWLNIGYLSDVKNPETGEHRFVSLPQGIPLDTMEPVKTNSSNNEYAAFMSARNDLMDQLLEHARNLAPGQTCDVNLTIQLRRVNEEQAPIDPKNNPYSRKLQF